MKIGSIYLHEAYEEDSAMRYEIHCDKDVLAELDRLLCEYLSSIRDEFEIYSTKDLKEMADLTEALIEIREKLAK